MINGISKESAVYVTKSGIQIHGDSRKILQEMDDESIDLVVTSPPFALLRKKAYGNEDQEAYVAWLSEFGSIAYSKLKETGSFVVDLGGSYQRGRPVRSLYNYRVLIDWVDRLGYNLAEEFFWFNPAKLPSPIEWVNKRKIRVKDAVNTVWWFSKSDFPKANVKNVLKPYSERMLKLLESPEKFYQPDTRPSGHEISSRFGDCNGGAIPPNLLEIPNTNSTSHYMRIAKEIGRKRHPARFPQDLPRFFIKFLTDEDDVVVDIFSGSNTTGYVAEQLGRKWIAIDDRLDYAALSAIRFMEEWGTEEIVSALERMESGKMENLYRAQSQQDLFATSNP